MLDLITSFPKHWNRQQKTTFGRNAEHGRVERIAKCMSHLGSRGPGSIYLRIFEKYLQAWHGIGHGKLNQTTLYVADSIYEVARVMDGNFVGETLYV